MRTRSGLDYSDKGFRNDINSTEDEDNSVQSGKTLKKMNVRVQDNCKECVSLKRELQDKQLDLDSERRRREKAECIATKFYEQMRAHSGVDYPDKGFRNDINSTEDEDNSVQSGKTLKKMNIRVSKCEECEFLRKELQKAELDLESEKNQRNIAELDFAKCSVVSNESSRKPVLVNLSSYMLNVLNVYLSLNVKLSCGIVDHVTYLSLHVYEPVQDNCKECVYLKRELQAKQLDLDSERRRETAECSATKLYEQKKAIKKELDVEKSWRMTNQTVMKTLIDKVPSYMNKHTPKDVKELEEKSYAISTSDGVKELKDEIELLRYSYTSLVESNLLLQNHHIAVVAVLQNFRKWVESIKFNKITRFKVFEPNEIDEALKSSQLIGSGGFGKVYKALLEDRIVAIKLLDQFSNRVVESLIRSHALVYEFLGNGTLEQRLDHRGGSVLSWKQRIDIVFKICCVLVFLHNLPKPIVHGDMKPENIMFDEEDTPKIGDFGISYERVEISDTGTWHHLTGNPRGTSCYMDPEFADVGKMTPSADVYAFGVILLQLVTGNTFPSGLVELVKEKLLSCTMLHTKTFKFAEEGVDEDAAY
ncbi:hypothetical protein HU200_046405 [Digitaria exilis]|uniref:RING-type E3 ubiquitin transferase n=1 Tax=Digitaria exilis TaxID=1010633 RepID=A0A835AW68_9POAL|nr:hypothetical protein HU200_046405 [Digitaria exilis]